LFQRGRTATAMERLENLSDEVTEVRSSVRVDEDLVERSIVQRLSSFYHQQMSDANEVCLQLIKGHRKLSCRVWAELKLVFEITS